MSRQSTKVATCMGVMPLRHAESCKIVSCVNEYNLNMRIEVLKHLAFDT
jgi:hypothetical protein